MKKIGIIGSGTMGIGIAQVASTAGCQVYLYDIDAQTSQKALLGLKSTLDKLVVKDKLKADRAQEIFNNIKPISQIADLHDADLVIEAIVENLEVKSSVFIEIEKVVSEHCILASNTSSISITSLAAKLRNPRRCIGLHFFNPAPLMPLVEVIPSLLTQEHLANELHQLMLDWKKTPVIVKDVPGFIVNRIARPFYGEALRIAEEGLASIEQIDDAMRSLGNFKMGPFELMDLIGIDINFSVTKTVFTDYFFDPKYKPSLLQQRMTEAQLLGRKTGKGFYDYAENAEIKTAIKDDALYQQIFERILAMLINEAVEVKRLKIADDHAIETAMQKGVNYPKGLLAWGQEWGYPKVSAVLQNLHDTYQEERYRQSPLLKQL